MAGLSKSLVEVGISMVLKDGFSQQAGRISGSYVQMMNDMTQWNRAVMQSAGAAFDYGIRAIESMTDAYKHYASISGEMFMVGRIAGASLQQQKDLLDLTRQVNLETPLTNADIVSGERYLAMAGNNYEKIQAMIRPAAELASIFQMQLGGKGGVADLMTNIMATFNIAADDASRTSDILYTAVTNANMNLTDLAQSLQYSGAVFRNAGVDLATASAAIGVLGDQGIQASSAGTALANMIRYLTLSITGQKTKGTDVLKNMGITRDDLVDAQGNLKDLGTLMGVLADKMKDLSGIDRESAMFNIFGIRGERAASGLLNALFVGSNKMSEIIDKANHSQGVAHETMQEFLQTEQGQINQLISATDNLKMAVGAVESTLFTPLVKSFTGVIKWVERIVSKDHGIGKFVIYLGNAAAITAVMVSAFNLIRGVIKIVNYQVAAINASTNKAAGGMGVINTQAAILEAHLSTIVALMAEYVAMSYAPGTRGMVLPVGGRLGRNKAGKPYVSYGGKAVSTATYGGLVTGAYLTGAAAGGGGTKPGPTPPSGGTKPGLGAGIKGASKSVLGFFGGWWGVGITAALTIIPMILNKVNGKMDKTIDALNNNTNALNSNQAEMNYLENYTEAIRRAVEASNSKSSTVNITVNGRPVGSFMDGESVALDMDDYGFEY